MKAGDRWSKWRATKSHIGRDPSNGVVLRSPLVSRHHAVVRAINGELELENLGSNSCLVGEDEVMGGSHVRFPSSLKVRIWPYTLSFETQEKVAVTRAELEAHLRIGHRRPGADHSPDAA